MSWQRISLLLCVFGFLKQLKPSEPFFVEYLTGSWKNITEEQIYQEIYPPITYSYAISLLPVLLLTDFLRYKPVIILGGICAIIFYIGIITAKTVLQLKLFEILNGLFLSTEVAYFSYIYAKVNKVHFQAVASHTRVAYLLGSFVSGVTAQLIVSFNLLDYHNLNYVSLGGLICATTWALFLPSVDRSIYLHRKDDINSSTAELPKAEIGSIDLNINENQSDFKRVAEKEGQEKSYTFANRVRRAYFLLWKDFLTAYSNTYVLKWSIWWILTTCGFMQVISYVQVLWRATFEGANAYNGAMEASQTIIGALGAFGIGKLRLNWAIVGESTLSLFALIQGVLLLVASQTHNIWISYAAYIGFAVIYQTMMTITSSEVAKNIPEDSYGLVIGLNSLAGLLMQSLLTLIVCTNTGFALAIRPQWVVYGSYFITLGVLFMVISLFTVTKYRKTGEPLRLWETIDIEESYSKD